LSSAPQNDNSEVFFVRFFFGEKGIDDDDKGKKEEECDYDYSIELVPVLLVMGVYSIV